MEIQFDDLKYNFYKLLDIPINETKKKIKKKYQKLMLQYHPDKCTNLEKEIFYNISLAYEILSKEDTRKKYDIWLLNKNKDKKRLRTNYNNEIKNIKNYFPSRNDSFKEFVKNSEEVLNKHGKIIINDVSLSKKYIDISNQRIKLKVNKEKIKNNQSFNKIFKERKNNSNNIIKKSEDIISYTNTNISKNYINIDQYDKLYSNETVQDENFSSLDIAFLLHPEFFLKSKDYQKKKEELEEDFSKFKI